MKRSTHVIFAVIPLSIVSALCLSACGAKTGTGTSASSASVLESTASATSETTAAEEQASPAALSKEEFAAFFEKKELTLDNWQDYFHLSESEDISKDAFGEPTGEYVRYATIEANDNIRFLGDDPVFRFTITYTTERESYSPDGTRLSNDEPYTETSEEDVTLDYGRSALILSTEHQTAPSSNGYQKRLTTISDIDCTKIKGAILVTTIPDSAWTEDENVEKRGKCIMVNMGEGIYYRFYENGNVKHGSLTWIKSLSEDFSDFPGWFLWKDEYLAEAIGIEL